MGNNWIARGVLVTLLVAVAAGPVLAQSPADVAAQTQARLLAKRAAQADAYRNLAEQVKGLRISSQTLVRDFVAENDEIATSLRTFLRGAKMVGDPRYMADGSCEVTMEIPLLTVQTELTRIYQAHYKGSKYKINDFQELHVTNKIEKVVATGNGAPRPVGIEIYDDEGRAIVVPGAPLALPPEWRDIPAQARLMAKRAATADAYRNLAEQVKGFRIASDTYVRDFVAESDVIATNLNTFLRGAKVGEVRYLADMSVEVDVRVALQTVITTLTREYEAHYRGSKVKARDFENIRQEVKVDWVTATGTGLPPARYLPNQPPTVVVPPPATGGPDWIRNTARATGNGVRPADVESDAQARLLALRAGKLDALRNLGEQINGLRIDAQTTVRDFVATNDEVRTAMHTFIQGARTVTEDYNAATGEATVTVEAPLEQIWNLVVKHRR